MNDFEASPTRISDVAPTLVTHWRPDLPTLLSAAYLSTIGAIPTAPRMPAEMGGVS